MKNVAATIYFRAVREKTCSLHIYIFLNMYNGVFFDISSELINDLACLVTKSIFFYLRTKVRMNEDILNLKK